MNTGFRFIFYMLSFLLVSTSSSTYAQKDIKVKGISINKIDKKNAKQGNWVFYDSLGNVKLTTYYEDDNIVSPQVIYEHNDTAFIRFPKKDNEELFICYENNVPIAGSFVYTGDSSYLIALDSAYLGDSSLRKKINGYKNIIIEPLYMFGKSRIVDFISASYLASDFFTEKNIFVVLYISASGKVTKVAFPGNKNMLRVDQEHELTRIYLGMPRWQPLFKEKGTKESVIYLSNSLKPKWMF